MTAAAGKPLTGLRVVEFAGMGPTPFTAMLLADHGADVVRVVRPGTDDEPPDPLALGRPPVPLDLKTTGGRDRALALTDDAEVVLEGFRPGAMERLGLGPETCLARNPRLVYGRMTGWGQHGPLANDAGHDINYIAVAGALAHIGRAGQPPTPPLNLVGDYGGGLLMAFGLLAAVLEARASGRGRTVDTAMVDNASLFMTQMHAWRTTGDVDDTTRGANLLDSGAPFYDVYECADGGYVAVGAIEPKFFRRLLKNLDLGDELHSAQYDRARWPELRGVLARTFRTRTRDEWATALAGTDSCVSPVLSMCEAVEHPHNRRRNAFVTVDGVLRPAPAPRFTRPPTTDS